MSGHDRDIVILNRGFAGGLITFGDYPVGKRFVIASGGAARRSQALHTARDRFAALAMTREATARPRRGPRLPLPGAARFARPICRPPNLGGAALVATGYAWALTHWRQGSFYGMLSRMRFGPEEPHYRFRMLGRLHRLPEPPGNPA